MHCNSIVTVNGPNQIRVAIEVYEERERRVYFLKPVHILGHNEYCRATLNVLQLDLERLNNEHVVIRRNNLGRIPNVSLRFVCKLIDLQSHVDSRISRHLKAGVDRLEKQGAKQHSVGVLTGG